MVATIRGPIQPEELGIVAMHEQMLYALHGWENDPWITFNRPEAFAAIVSSLVEFKEAGGRTVVDCSGILLGRDAELLMNLAASAGIHIVASTGFGSQDSIPGHFTLPITEMKIRLDSQAGIAKEDQMWAPDAGYLSDMFYSELAKGMAAPGMRRTGLKAGIVKGGTSWDQITEAEELSLRGAAIAAKRAGVAVITTGFNQAQRQLEILLEEGLEPDRIVVGHCDDGRAINLERDKAIARKGAYVAYDHVGWEDASLPYSIPDARRVELVKAMVQAGFTERIILSCSAIGYAIGAPRSKHSFSHLLKSFVPQLKKAGVSEGAINTILVENPKRILTPRVGL